MEHSTITSFVAGLSFVTYFVWRKLRIRESKTLEIVTLFFLTVFWEIAWIFIGILLSINYFLWMLLFLKDSDHRPSLMEVLAIVISFLGILVLLFHHYWWIPPAAIVLYYISIPVEERGSTNYIAWAKMKREQEKNKNM